MREIAARIDIEAPPERVWQVLADFGAYGEWNPFMREVQGRAEEGAKLTIRMRRSGGLPIRFRARVLAAEPPRRLVWAGVGLRGHWPGLIRGERRITIEPLAGGRSRVEMETRFTGLLSSLMSWLDRYRSSFNAMERALKARAEDGVAAGAEGGP